MTARRLQPLKGHPRRRLRTDLRELGWILEHRGVGAGPVCFAAPDVTRALALVLRMHGAIDEIPVAASGDTHNQQEKRG